MWCSWNSGLCSLNYYCFSVRHVSSLFIEINIHFCHKKPSLLYFLVTHLVWKPLRRQTHNADIPSPFLNGHISLVALAASWSEYQTCHSEERRLESPLNTCYLRFRPDSYLHRPDSSVHWQTARPLNTPWLSARCVAARWRGTEKPRRGNLRYTWLLSKYQCESLRLNLFVNLSSLSNTHEFAPGASTTPFKFWRLHALTVIWSQKGEVVWTQVSRSQGR